MTFHPVGPVYDDGLNPNASFDDDVWELYHVAEDLSETEDLAAAEPERLAAMIELWWEEAERNDVLPLDNRPLWALIHKPPDPRRDRAVFRYFQGGAPVPESVAVPVQNRSTRCGSTSSIDDGVVPHGVLLALGSALGGWSLHFLDGHLRYVHNLYGKTPPRADQPRARRRRVPTGWPSRSPRTKASAGRPSCWSTARWSPRVSSTASPRPVSTALGVGLTCGYEWGPAVGEGYEAPFTFNGPIDRAEVEVTGPVVRDPLAEIAAILAEQ